MSDITRTQLASRSQEQLEIDDHDLQKGKEESIEVSYSILNVEQYGQENPDLLQKIATIVNVQLAMEGSETLPFVSFINFDTAKHSDKLFLYGPSGCGKSRAIFELVKENLGDFKKIYFINPRNTVGTESGRIKLLDLIGKLQQDDGVVWDNFPDDLVKRDLESARDVLEMVSSRNVKRLLVALKPKYLEIYRDLPNRIPDFNSCKVVFDKERLRNIIISYGTAIAQFKQLFQKYVVEYTDKISRILWQKEPTPLTILGYYKLLISHIEIQKTNPNILRTRTESGIFTTMLMLVWVMWISILGIAKFRIMWISIRTRTKIMWIS
jgi:hypothetical protein